MELIAATGVMVMSDRNDVAFLGGQALTRRQDSTLWYQADGIVAAGLTPLDRQFGYLRNLGFTMEEIWAMVSFMSAWALGIASASLSDGIGFSRCSLVGAASLGRSVASVPDPASR